jgi:hypothetical protein
MRICSAPVYSSAPFRPWPFRFPGTSGPSGLVPPPLPAGSSAPEAPSALPESLESLESLESAASGTLSAAPALESPASGNRSLSFSLLKPPNSFLSRWIVVPFSSSRAKTYTNDWMILSRSANSSGSRTAFARSRS